MTFNTETFSALSAPTTLGEIVGPTTANTAFQRAHGLGQAYWLAKFPDLSDELNTGTDRGIRHDGVFNGHSAPTAARAGAAMGVAPHNGNNAAALNALYHDATDPDAPNFMNRFVRSLNMQLASAADEIARNLVRDDFAYKLKAFGTLISLSNLHQDILDDAGLSDLRSIVNNAAHDPRFDNPAEVTAYLNSLSQNFEYDHVTNLPIFNELVGIHQMVAHDTGLPLTNAEIEREIISRYPDASRVFFPDGNVEMPNSVLADMLARDTVLARHTNAQNGNLDWDAFNDALSSTEYASVKGEIENGLSRLDGDAARNIRSLDQLRLALPDIEYTAFWNARILKDLSEISINIFNNAADNTKNVFISYIDFIKRFYKENDGSVKISGLEQFPEITSGIALKALGVMGAGAFGLLKYHTASVKYGGTDTPEFNEWLKGELVGAAVGLPVGAGLLYVAAGSPLGLAALIGGGAVLGYFELQEIFQDIIDNRDKYEDGSLLVWFAEKSLALMNSLETALGSAINWAASAIGEFAASFGDAVVTLADLVIPEIGLVSGASAGIVSEDGAWLVGTEAAVLIGSIDNDTLIHAGAGEVFGLSGDDILLGWRATEYSAGDRIGTAPGEGEEDTRPIAEHDLSLKLHGGEGDDWIIKIGGERATLIGGEGEDWIVGGNAEIWGGEYEGSGDGERDDFWVFGGAHVMDAEVVDRAAFGGMSLRGGIAYDWQEEGHAYWTPGGTALQVALGAFSSAAGTLSLLSVAIDVVAGLMVRYGATDDGGLVAEFFAGRGGAAGFENYELDLATGEATAGITAFRLGFVGEGERSLETLRQTVSLIFQQSFASQSVYSGTDPLVLDLDGDGIEVGRYSTYFDMTADGFAEQTDWIWGGDGFLARDIDGNDQIDDISELFGDADTPAFAALAALDGNSDGMIDANDADFSELSVWVDANNDGITDAGELQSLTAHGIASIDLAATDVTDTEIRGNALRATSTFTRTDGTTGEAADVLLNSDLTDTRWLGDSTVSTDAAATLALKGFGRVKNLDVAMTDDATLLGLVQAFASFSGNNWAVFQVQVEDIFLRWTGADQVAATPMGPEFDEAKLAALETWLGQELSTRDAVGAPNPSQFALDQLEESYGNILDDLTIKLAVQGPLASAFAGTVYSAETDRIKLDSPGTLTQIIAGILAGLPSDPAAADAEWTSVWAPLLNTLFPVTDRADGVELKDDFVVASALAAVEQSAGPLDLATLVDGLRIETVHIGNAGNNTLARSDVGLQVFVGGEGDDALNGSGGQSVFIYGSEWGQDTITDGERIDIGDRIRFSTLNEDQVTIVRDDADLLITRNGSSDSIRVKGQYNEVVRGLDGSILSGDFGVEEIQFADGAIWDFTDIFQAVGLGTSGDDDLTFTDHDDWIEGLEGADLLNGGDGGDVYFYSAGHGTDTIVDEQTDPLGAIQDAIVFEAGISFEDFEVSRTGSSDDLEITFGPDSAATDKITVQGQFWYGPLGVKGGDNADGIIGAFLGSSTRFATDNRIEAFVFQDGPPLTWAEVQQRLIERSTTDAGDTVYGFGSQDVFGASTGDDLLIGFDGGDTYHFGRGSGNDTIEERTKYLTTLGTDGIVFGTGIAPGDIVFDRPSEAPDLRMTIADTGDTLTVKKQFNGFAADFFGLLGVQWFDRIETFTFADGTVLTWEDVLGLVTTGTDGNDTLYGDHYADTLDGGLGDDHLGGKDDGDLYVVRSNEGNDTIEDGQEDLTHAAPDVLRFEGLAEADVTFSRDLNAPDDLIATIADGGSVTIKDHYKVIETWVLGNQGFDRVEQFEWTDGTKAWQTVEAELIAASKTAGDDTVLGTHYDNVLDGGTGNDILKGGNGSDEYRFDLGGGSDIIEDGMDNILATTADRIVFGAGLNHSLVQYTRSGDDLTIGFTGLSETLEIKDMFKFFDTGPFGVRNFGLIEEITFGDGTTRSWTQIMADLLAQAKTGGADVIEGFYFDDRLDGGAGNDTLIGKDGNDTYVFDVGYGHDIIREDRDSIFSDADNDTVEFGDGIDPDDIRITRVASAGFAPPDLKITIDGNTQDSLTLEGTFTESTVASTMQRIERFTFLKNGSEWSLDTIKQKALESTTGADVLIGFGGADRLDGGTGDDQLDGRIGDDTYVFGVGYGDDTIEETGEVSIYSGLDTVEFVGGVGPDDIMLAASADGRDLIVTLLDAADQPTGDTLTITDQLDGLWFKRIERFAFSDAANTVWNYSDIVIALLGDSSTDGDDTLSGSTGDDILDGGFGNDVLSGLKGNDTYKFGRGYGQDIVRDKAANATDGGNDSVQLSDGLALNDLSITRGGYRGRDLTLGVTGTGDSLTIENAFGSQFWRIEAYEMSETASNGMLQPVTYSLGSGPDSFETLLLAADATPGDDLVEGFDHRADTITGGAGTDTLVGYNYGDTYLFGLSDGHDTVDDNSIGSGAQSGGDRVVLGEGIDPETVKLSRNGNDVTFKVDGYDASLTIKGQFIDVSGVNVDEIEEFVFADGTIWTVSDLQEKVLEQFITEGDDGTIKGYRSDDILDGLAGADRLEGGRGSDTYIFRAGSGTDVVFDQGGLYDIDVVRFLGLNLEDVSVGRNVYGAYFTLAGGDSLTVEGAFSSNATNRIETYIFDDAILSGADLRRTILEATTSDGDDSIEAFDYFQMVLDAGSGNDIVNGSYKNDTLYGGEGADILDGRTGSDQLYGGEGDDRLYGNSGDDDLFGGAGDDLLSGGTGYDTFHGGDGSDTIDFTYSSSTSTVIYDLPNGEIRFSSGTVETLTGIENITTFANGVATFVGTADANTFIGGNKDDLLQGFGGNDTLVGRRGSDTLLGGAGDDILRHYESVSGELDILDGGGGADTADFSGFLNAVWVDLSYSGSTSFEAWTRDGTNVSAGAWRAIADLASIENVVGTAFDDRIVGDTGDNVIIGGEGADELHGDAGDDRLILDTGFDDAHGDAGTDTADFSRYQTAVWVDLDYTGATGFEAWTRGGSNVDSGAWQAIANLTDIENVVGSEFDDIFYGDAGDNVFAGDGGSDVFFLEAGFDDIDGGVGTDRADFSTHQTAVWIDLAYTGATGFEAWTLGGSTVTSGTWQAIANLENIEDLVGSAFDDKIWGDASSNVLTAGMGDDILFGRAGDDRFVLEGGFDDIDGEAGIDHADFSAYQTAVWVDLDYTGATGFEAWTRGGSNVDSGAWQAIANLTDIENVTGSEFDDILYGDAGDNVFAGRDGMDVFFLEAGFDDIDGGMGTDRADFSTYQTAVWIDLAYTGATGFEAWTLGGSTVTSGTWQAIANLENIEDLVGSAFDDKIWGDASSNVLTAGMGDDILFGRAGDDRFVLKGGFDDIDGEAGIDHADFSTYQTAVWVDLDYTGAAGFEAWTRGGSNVDSGAWQAIANLESVENVTGSAFDDYLVGDSGNNHLTGGNGTDAFHFKVGFGSDTITDFQDTGSGFEDVLNFSLNANVNSMADITGISVANGDTVVSTTDGTITLSGAIAGIDAADFVFT